jgi:hypothetical protein
MPLEKDPVHLLSAPTDAAFAKLGQLRLLKPKQNFVVKIARSVPWYLAKFFQRHLLKSGKGQDEGDTVKVLVQKTGVTINSPVLESQ